MAHTFITRANLSKQLPTAMSMVSPNILYRRSEYAITCTGRENNNPIMFVPNKHDLVYVTALPTWFHWQLNITQCRKNNQTGKSSWTMTPTRGKTPVCSLHWRKAQWGCWLLWWVGPSQCVQYSGWHRGAACPKAARQYELPEPPSPGAPPYQDLREKKKKMRKRRGERSSQNGVTYSYMKDKIDISLRRVWWWWWIV